MKKINLPNKLTILRVIMIPFVMAFIMADGNGEGQMWLDFAAAGLFLIATLTDMLDGMIARKHNLVTNFGKFMDPLADKLLVFGTFFAMFANSAFDKYRYFLVIAVTLLLFRELAVTSIRLIAAKSDGKVIAANNLGKIKTVSQSVCIIPMLICHNFLPDGIAFIINCTTLSVMLFFTVLSGTVYIKQYASYIEFN